MPDTGSAYGGRNGKRKILLVEDEPVNRKMLLTILQDSYDVITAEGGQEAAEKLAAKQKKGPGDFDLNDFLDQMHQIKKMGPLQNVLGMLPGIGAKLKDVEVDENALKKPEAIICSMTLKERRNPAILNASRRKRIAAGAGVTVQDVNALIRQFEQMQKMVKQMMGNKRGAFRAMKKMGGLGNLQ